MAVMDAYSGEPLIIDLGDGGDLSFQGGQPKMSSGLENAAYLSLFVDANWWGNDVDPATPGATGSRHFLPLTARAKLTPDFLKDGKAAAEADLAWMVEEGSAKSVTAELSIVARGVCGVELTIVEPDGAVTTSKWKLNWDYMRAYGDGGKTRPTPAPAYLVDEDEAFYLTSEDGFLLEF